MKSKRTETTLTALVLSGLISLSASGLAGAHGAPDAEDVPKGFVKASITSQPDIQGLSTLILDAPQPGILLRYQGDGHLTVLGIKGEKFLRFTRETVEVNVASPSWKNLPNVSEHPGNEAARAEQSGQVSWTTLSRSGSFGWLDPRLNDQHDGHAQSGPRTWSIAVKTTEGGTDHISGELTFKPIQ